MIDPREQIWANAFNACLGDGKTVADAAHAAEKALNVHEARWPGNREAVPREQYLADLAGARVSAVCAVVEWANRIPIDTLLARRDDAREVVAALIVALRSFIVISPDGEPPTIAEAVGPWSPPDQKSIGGVLDMSMLRRAVAELEAGGRFDALVVFKNFVDAVAEAHREGKSLSGWTPPMRGG